MAKFLSSIPNSLQGGGTGGGTTSGAAGKNYVLNPNAATNTDDVTLSGAWSVTRTVDAAELPEATVGSAFKISGTVAVDDYVEWAIEPTFIDDADGGRIGTARVSVKDIAGTVAGKIALRVYNATTSSYVDQQSDEITGDGVYLASVPLSAEEDIRVRLVALDTNVTAFAVSSVTLEPGIPQSGSFGGWKQYDDSVVTFSSTPAGWSLTRAVFVPYKSINGEWRMTFNIVASTDTGTTPSVTIDGVTFKNTFAFNQALVVDSGNQSFTARAEALNNTGTISVQKSGSTPIFRVSGDVELESIPTWADFDNTVPLASDVQYDSAMLIASSNNGQAFTSSSTIIYEDVEEDLFSIYNNSTGEITIPHDGRYTITAVLARSVASEIRAAIFVDGVVRVYGTNSIGSSVSATLRLQQGQVVTIRNTANSGNLVSDSAFNLLTVTKVADYSARATGLPTSQIASSDQQFLVPEYREVDLTLDGSYTGGIRNLKVTRVGRTISVSCDGNATHSSATSASTSTSFLPSWAIPVGEKFACNYAVNGTEQVTVIRLDGSLDTFYTSGGSPSSQAATIVPINISYTI